jgi:hypothetical protein
MFYPGDLLFDSNDECRTCCDDCGEVFGIRRETVITYDTVLI